MATIRVKAAPLADPALAGKRRVPKEGTTQRYITEAEPIEVELTPYYQRKLRSGELVRCDADQPAARKSSGLKGVITSTGEE